jgi:hypothetical protein
MEIAIVLSVLSLVVSVVAVIVGYVTARKYGDMAAVKATRKFHEEDIARARVGAFQSLTNEVVRIRELAKYYEEPREWALPKMPTTAFEKAFVSGSPGLAASGELVKVASEYLVLASRINLMVDMYLADRNQPSGVRLPDIRRFCTSLSEVLDRLSDCLNRELEEAQRRLR